MADNLYRRGKTWWGRIQVDGKELRRSLRTTDRAEARRRLREWKAEISHAAHYGEARLTWTKAAGRYGEEVMPGAIKPSTAKRYVVSFRQVLPHLEGQFIDAIGRREIAAMIGKRKAAGVTNATIKRDLTAVSRVFAAAIGWGACEHNPALEFDRQMIRERRDPITLPTDEDVTSALALAPPGFRPIIAIAAQTGMRQAEIIALHWSQVDLVRRAINLDRTKTDAPRAVPLSGPLLAEAVGTLSGTPRIEGCPLVFWHGAGQPYRNFSSQFKAWRDRHGLPFRFHDLRHKFAVSYLRLGGNIYDLQRILGHKSIKTTEIYLNYLTPDERAGSISGPAQISAQV